MEDLHFKLIQSYKNCDYDIYINFMDEYSKKGYGFEYEMILGYAKILRKTRKYDQAYKILKILERQVDKYDIVEDLCKEYINCFKPNDAFRLYNLKKINFRYKSILIKMYLLQGKVKDAKEVLDEALNTKLHDNDYKLIMKYKYEIDNYYKYGSFI